MAKISFNQLRYAASILASFGCLFAYVCRYNLPLALLEMVEKSKNPIKHDQPIGSFGIDDALFSHPNHDVEHNNHDQNEHINEEPEGLISINVSRNVGYNSYLNSNRYQNNKNENIKNLNGNRNKLFDKNSDKYVIMELKNISPTNRQRKSIVNLNTQNAGNSDNNNNSILVSRQTEIDDNLISRLNINLENSKTNVKTSPNNSEQSENVKKTSKISWSDLDQSFVMGAFFYGYVISQLPSARAAELFGAKLLFTITGLGSGIISLIFPWCSKSGSLILPILVRSIMGVCQSSMFAAAYELLSKWLPPVERTKFLAIPSTFSRLGFILSYVLYSPIKSRFDWEGVFYFSGAITLLWTLIWLLISSSEPKLSRIISKKEFSYIDNNFNQQQEQNDSNNNRIDYFKIIKSYPVWIFTLSLFASEWSNMILLILLPQFLTHVVKFSMQETGNWSSALVVVYCLAFPLSGYLSSKFVNYIRNNNSKQNQKQQSTMCVRKVFELTAHLLQALACSILALVDSKSALASVAMPLLFLMMLGRSIVGGGQIQMPNELSPQFPGTIFAFGNTFANFANVIGPTFASYIITDKSDYQHWQRLWISSACLFLFISVIFLIFGNNEARDYSCTPPEKSKSTDKNSDNKNQQQNQPYNSPMDTMPFDDFFTLSSPSTKEVIKLS